MNRWVSTPIVIKAKNPNHHRLCATYPTPQCISHGGAAHVEKHGFRNNSGAAFGGECLWAGVCRCNAYMFGTLEWLWGYGSNPKKDQCCLRCETVMCPLWRWLLSESGQSQAVSMGMYQVRRPHTLALHCNILVCWAQTLLDFLMLFRAASRTAPHKS